MENNVDTVVGGFHTSRLAPCRTLDVAYVHSRILTADVEATGTLG